MLVYCSEIWWGKKTDLNMNQSQSDPFFPIGFMLHIIKENMKLEH